MLCEHANPKLIEYAAGELPEQVRSEVERHLNSCETCQADYDSIAQFRTMASTWHDEVVPNWKPPRVPSRDLFENFRLWFPTAASTAALAMATLIFVQLPEPSATLPSGSQMPADYQALPQLPQATQAAMVQSVMEGSREQRQEELQALLKILKAEMDRRSIETEESLKFIISNQLQGQQELDELYRQVEDLMLDPEQANATRTVTGGTGGEVNR